MRKTVTIIAAAIVILGIAVAAYFYFFGNSGGLTVGNGASTENPFPSSSAAEQTGTDETDAKSADATVEAGVQVAPRLVKITAGPVAKGLIALDASTTPVISLAEATSSVATSSMPSAQPSYAVEIRYIDRGSGNMYAYHVSDGTSVRLTNHTAPGVQEASWLADGSLAYIRFLVSDAAGEHVETYALPANGGSGYLLARNLSQVLAEGSKDIFVLSGNAAGSIGTIEKPDGSGAASLFSSSLGALSVHFAGANLIADTKPSFDLPGYAFLIERATGAFSTLLGPLYGLSTLPSPDGTSVLYSYLNNGALALAFINPKTHAATALPLATLADKCVWAKNAAVYCAVPTSIPSGAGLPDSWYQGTVSFSDRIWRIDLVARVATLVADLPELASASIDAQSLSLDPYGSTLVFTNRSDGSLWAYSI